MHRRTPDCVPPCAPGVALAGRPSTKEQIDFAAAVQAGIAYNINESITWDNGWQMLWEADSIASVSPVGLRRKHDRL